MRYWMRKVFILSLICCLMAGAAMGETYSEDAQIIELPEPENGEFVILTPSEDPAVGPDDKYYLYQKGASTPYGYADPSITVNIGTGRFENTNYMYARVKIADPSQIRIKTAQDTLSKTNGLWATSLAKRVKAVIAMNGVLEADKSMGSKATGVKIDGPVMIQGEWWRPVNESKIEKWRQGSAWDTLVIDDQGNLNVIEAETWGEVYDQILELEFSPVNVFCFGPALVVNGEPRYGYNNRQMSSGGQAQRAALCQTGELEYLLVTSEGPDQEQKAGLTIDKFAELISTRFPEVRTAYNLDGGNSSMIIFRKDTDNWSKINAKGQKLRDLRDIIYFADAWIPDEIPGKE